MFDEIDVVMSSVPTIGEPVASSWRSPTPAAWKSPVSTTALRTAAMEASRSVRSTG